MTSAGAQHYCLRWNNYQSNLTATFEQLLQNETLVDVTLAVSGRSLKAHKIILSACSPYFHSILGENPCNHPIIILQDVSYADMHAVIQFMYKGEIHVTEQQLPSLLKVAETLKIRGLADVPDSSLLRRASPEGGTHKETASPSPRAVGTPETLETYVDMPASISPSSGGAGVTPTSAMRGPLSLQHQHPGRAGQHAEQQEGGADIRPAIAEMIKDEERAKLLESATAWNTPSPETTFQHQLQQAWQKSWNQKQSLLQNLRFRERGSIKSWRPETMADAIMSVLREGHTLSQAARKFDIPYPTFVLYANRVHNLLGPSLEGPGCSPNEMRPKGRGRPQRILLGSWPDDTIKNVIRAVVFRDTSALKEQLDEQAAAARNENGTSPASKLAQCQPLNGRLPYSMPAPPISQVNGVVDASSVSHSQHQAMKQAPSAPPAMGAAARGQLPNLLGFPDVHMMMRMFPPGAMSASGAVPTINLPALNDIKSASTTRQPPSRPVPPLSSISAVAPSSSPVAERSEPDPTPADRERWGEPRADADAEAGMDATGGDVREEGRLEPIILPRRLTGESSGEPTVAADGAMDARTEPVRKSRSEEQEELHVAGSSEQAVPEPPAELRRRSPATAELPDMPRLVSAALPPAALQTSGPPMRSLGQPMRPPWQQSQGSAGAPSPALQAMP